MRALLGRGIVVLLALALAGCVVGRPAPVYKLGFLAPFEGESRAIGYRLLPAVRGATPERVRGASIEWIILDTHADPGRAAEAARELLLDPALLAVIGPVTPDEVAAVAPIVEAAGVAWWPLAPRGASGVSDWSGSLADGVPAGQLWGASAWPALRRATELDYLDPVPPAPDPGLAAIAGERPAPLEWLAWEATARAVGALERAIRLDRRGVREAARPLELPPAGRYISRDGRFPGELQRE